PWGGWGSTQATAWSLRALERLRMLDSGKPVTLTVSQNGRPLTRRDTGNRAPTRLEPGDVQRITWEMDQTAPGTLSVNLSTTDTTSAMVLASIAYAVPWTDPEADTPEARLKVEVEASSRQASRGQAVELSVTVTNATRDPHGAIIAELPLPPGATVDQDLLDDWVRQGRVDRFELLPTHVRLYIPGLQPEAQRTFTYPVTVLIEGAFSIPPARAYIFYTPNPVTEVDGGPIEVNAP
ncbi:MAG: hypothetical protein AAFX99_09325, partial [Myxococcota bacterium]